MNQIIRILSYTYPSTTSITYNYYINEESSDSNLQSNVEYILDNISRHDLSLFSFANLSTDQLNYVFANSSKFKTVGELQKSANNDNINLVSKLQIQDNREHTELKLKVGDCFLVATDSLFLLESGKLCEKWENSGNASYASRAGEHFGTCNSSPLYIVLDEVDAMGEFDY